MKPVERFVSFLSKFTVLSAVLCIILGYLLSRIVPFNQFSIETKLNPLEFLSIIVTITAAYYVSTVLDKSKQDYRSAKDLILKRCEEVHGYFLELSLSINKPSAPFGDITSVFKKITTSIQTINNVSSKKLNFENLERKTLLEGEINRLRVLLTNTPLANQRVSNPSITISNNAVTYSPLIINEAEVLLARIKNIFLEYQIEITQC